MDNLKTTFKRNKNGTISISFNGMTQGKALALCFALNQHAERSAVCNDLVDFLKYSIQREGKTDEDQELYALLNAKE